MVDLQNNTFLHSCLGTLRHFCVLKHIMVAKNTFLHSCRGTFRHFCFGTDRHFSSVTVLHCSFGSFLQTWNLIVLSHLFLYHKSKQLGAALLLRLVFANLKCYCFITCECSSWCHKSKQLCTSLPTAIQVLVGTSWHSFLGTCAIWEIVKFHRANVILANITKEMRKLIPWHLCKMRNSEVSSRRYVSQYQNWNVESWDNPHLQYWKYY